MTKVHKIIQLHTKKRRLATEWVSIKFEIYQTTVRETLLSAEFRAVKKCTKTVCTHSSPAIRVIIFRTRGDDEKIHSLQACIQQLPNTKFLK